MNNEIKDLESNDLGQIINKARTDKGISQRKLAKLVGMDCAEVSRIEAGQRKKPNVLYLKGISETLDLDLTTLMELAGYNYHEIDASSSLPKINTKIDNNKHIEEFIEFYGNVLNIIDERRKNALEVRNICFNIIDNFHNPEHYGGKYSYEDVVAMVMDISRKLEPNVKEYNKGQFPNFDELLKPKK